MAKVLRLHKGAADTIGNWDTSVKIGSKAIDSIADPIGANDEHEITSIPSPFARMDLVKRAFKIVAEGSLEGKTAYHKLVSDCLDVGQIFFNIEKYRDKIEIIVWDKKNCLAELSDSDYEEHTRLGKTYKTYLEQDSDEYNFGQMDCIYLLNYIDESAPGVMNIIGATSPATIFFTSANELQYVGKKIKFGNDSPFDKEYKPLYKRDFEYIKYWWSLKNSRTDFADVFPEVDLYLEKCFKYLTGEQKSELRQSITNTNYYLQSYDEITVVPMAQQYVTVLNHKLRRRKTDTKISSGFEILVSDKLASKPSVIPLALPVSKYTDPTLYVTSNWDKDTYVPYLDSRPINARTLPDDGTAYPYITISDVLEDSIIRIPHKINPKGYFDGNYVSSDNQYSYLLPIKKEYFDYFTVEDLRGKVCGKNAIEIQQRVGGVNVVLRIPIKGGGCIQYDRLYCDGAPKADPSSNKGRVIDKELTLGTYPGIHYKDVTPYYRVSLLDIDSVQGVNSGYMLDFYNESNCILTPEDIIRRNRNTDGSRYSNIHIDTVTYALAHNYKYIQLHSTEQSDLKGIIIPIFETRTGNQKYRFAIDFGTTNTHIEYSVDNSQYSKPFDITESDCQIQKLHSIDKFSITSVFNSDLIPDLIGGNSLYGYPMRTVLSESRNTNWSKAVYTMGNVNIPFTYEKMKALPYNDLKTDLKWSIDENDQKRALKYIESILLMIRTKVLLNHGDLAKTEIVWFYPASMTEDRYNTFSAEWNKCYRKLFGGSENNIVSMSESIAPFYYHNTEGGATSTVVSIDIGGGTTDVMIVDNDEPKYLTSFRFAANTIFGDGYSFASKSNGFVNKYLPEIAQKLGENSLGELQGFLSSVVEKNKSTDIIAFFFSLANNKEIIRNNIEIDFGKSLSNDGRGKYAILMFYTAILYHIANIMKDKGINMPRHITFSGNGSKVISILTPSKTTLSDYTKLIFESIYNESYNKNGLEIHHSPEDSKEATCKGGIKHFDEQKPDEIDRMKTILLGTTDVKYADRMLYRDIDATTIDSVVNSVTSFINFFFSLSDKFSFKSKFGIDISIIEDIRDICYLDIDNYLNQGLKHKKEKENVGDNESIEETLFFYPLTGIINAIVRNMYKI